MPIYPSPTACKTKQCQTDSCCAWRVRVGGADRWSHCFSIGPSHSVCNMRFAANAVAWLFSSGKNLAWAKTGSPVHFKTQWLNTKPNQPQTLAQQALAAIYLIVSANTSWHAFPSLPATHSVGFTACLSQKQIRLSAWLRFACAACTTGLVFYGQPQA